MQFDQDTINLAKAIRMAESGGNDNPEPTRITRTEGSVGGFQFLPETFNAMGKKYLGGKALDGRDLDINDPSHQNLVALSYIKSKKDEGYQAGDIAASWNAGEGRISDWQNMRGVNRYGNAYDVPAYVNKVGQFYQQIKGQTPQPQTQPEEKKSSALFKSNPDDGLITSAAKAVGNVPGNAVEIAKGLFNMVNHPIQTVTGIKDLAVGELDTLAGGEGTDVSQQFNKGVKETFSSGENFKKAVVENPLDTALWFSGGAGVLGKGAKLGGLSRTANVLEKVSQYTDPVAGVVDATAGAVSKGRGLLSREVTPEDAISSFKKNLGEQVEDKKSLMKAAEGKTTDVIDTIGSNPRYHPEINAETKSIDASKAITNIESDLKTMAEKTGELFRKVDEIDGGIPVKEALGAVKKFFENKDIKAIRTAAPEVINYAMGLQKRMIENYGGTIKREELWNLRKIIDETVTFTDPTIKQRVAYGFRTAFKNALEGSVKGGEGDLVKRSMADMQKLIEAKDFLTKDGGGLHGSKISAGKLGQYMKNFLGTQTGQMAGAAAGAAVGGVVPFLGSLVGGAVGYVTASKIGKYLAENTLTNSAERIALKKFLDDTPTVWDEVDQYISGLNASQKTNAQANMMVAQLPPRFGDALDMLKNTDPVGSEYIKRRLAQLYGDKITEPEMVTKIIMDKAPLFNLSIRGVINKYILLLEQLDPEKEI